MYVAFDRNCNKCNQPAMVKLEAQSSKDNKIVLIGYFCEEHMEGEYKEREIEMKPGDAITINGREE